MTSKIEWTEETWNPIVGCSKVSPGCDHCYAERMAYRLSYSLGAVTKTGPMDAWAAYSSVIGDNKKWNGVTKLVQSALSKPMKWKKPRTIFVCSMGDLFHESVPFEWIDDVFGEMTMNPRHTYLILTKRPERMYDYIQYMNQNIADAGYDGYYPSSFIWLGVTAENQEQADKRIPILLQIPAAKRFVSIEPMLGPVKLDFGSKECQNCKGTGSIPVNGGGASCPICLDYSNGTGVLQELDWVICGGESGPRARPIHPDWVRSIRDQCQATNVPFFFKQWGEYAEGSHGENKSTIVLNNGDFASYDSNDLTKKYGSVWQNFQATVMKRVGKKKAGHLIEGKEWRETP